MASLTASRRLVGGFAEAQLGDQPIGDESGAALKREGNRDPKLDLDLVSLVAGFLGRQPLFVQRQRPDLRPQEAEKLDLLAQRIAAAGCFRHGLGDPAFHFGMDQFADQI